MPKRQSSRPVPHRAQIDAIENAILDAFGRRVRALAEGALGEEVAYDLGISTATLSRIMSGETIATAPLAKRMADYWGVPVCELLRIPGQPAHPEGAERQFHRLETGEDPTRAVEARPDLQDLVVRILRTERTLSEPRVVLRLLLALLDALPAALQSPSQPAVRLELPRDDEAPDGEPAE